MQRIRRVGMNKTARRNERFLSTVFNCFHCGRRWTPDWLNKETNGTTTSPAKDQRDENGKNYFFHRKRPLKLCLVAFLNALSLKIGTRLPSHNNSFNREVYHRSASLHWRRFYQPPHQFLFPSWSPQPAAASPQAPEIFYHHRRPCRDTHQTGRHR
jgi:hypothetical protein